MLDLVVVRRIRKFLYILNPTSKGLNIPFYLLFRLARVQKSSDSSSSSSSRNCCLFRPLLHSSQVLQSLPHSPTSHSRLPHKPNPLMSPINSFGKVFNWDLALDKPWLINHFDTKTVKFHSERTRKIEWRDMADAFVNHIHKVVVVVVSVCRNEAPSTKFRSIIQHIGLPHSSLSCYILSTTRRPQSLFALSLIYHIVYHLWYPSSNPVYFLSATRYQPLLSFLSSVWLTTWQQFVLHFLPTCLCWFTDRFPSPFIFPTFFVLSAWEHSNNHPLRTSHSVQKSPQLLIFQEMSSYFGAQGASGLEPLSRQSPAAIRFQRKASTGSAPVSFFQYWNGVTISWSNFRYVGAINISAVRLREFLFLENNRSQKSRLINHSFMPFPWLCKVWDC